MRNWMTDIEKKNMITYINKNGLTKEYCENNRDKICQLAHLFQVSLTDFKSFFADFMAQNFDSYDVLSFIKNNTDLQHSVEKSFIEFNFPNMPKWIVMAMSFDFTIEEIDKLNIVDRDVLEVLPNNYQLKLEDIEKILKNGYKYSIRWQNLLRIFESKELSYDYLGKLDYQYCDFLKSKNEFMNLDLFFYMFGNESSDYYNKRYDVALSENMKIHRKTCRTVRRMLNYGVSKLEKVLDLVNNTIYDKECRERMLDSTTSNLASLKSKYNSYIDRANNALINKQDFDLVMSDINKIINTYYLNKCENLKDAKIEVIGTQIYGKACYDLSGESHNCSSELKHFIEELLNIEVKPLCRKKLPQHILDELIDGLMCGSIGADCWRYYDIDLNVNIDRKTLTEIIESYNISAKDYNKLNKTTIQDMLKM